jgi:hypothetical protein
MHNDFTSTKLNSGLTSVGSLVVVVVITERQVQAA